MMRLALILLLFGEPAHAQLQMLQKGGSKKPPAVTHYLLLQKGGKISLQGGGSLQCTGPC